MHPSWKGREKLSLFKDYVMPWMKDSKDSTKNLLELINKFNKVSVYTNNTLPNQSHL